MRLIIVLKNINKLYMNIIYENTINTQYIQASTYFVVNNQFVKDKNIIQNEPIFSFKHQFKKHFSIMLIDLQTSFLHWWVSNIDLENEYKEIWINYFSPFLDEHTYVFYIFYQPFFIDKPEYINPFKFRDKFKVKEYCAKFNLKLINTKYFILNTL